mmetsp:Transcript_6746/g.16391  ORF Transcript_6746/g.16391 Transcript_6746/m.16391 type:complete len:220 (+) Transcript_6746:468-1127(+)
MHSDVDPRRMQLIHVLLVLAGVHFIAGDIEGDECILVGYAEVGGLLELLGTQRTDSYADHANLDLVVAFGTALGDAPLDVPQDVVEVVLEAARYVAGRPSHLEHDHTLVELVLDHLLSYRLQHTQVGEDLVYVVELVDEGAEVRHGCLDKEEIPLGRHVVGGEGDALPHILIDEPREPDAALQVAVKLHLRDGPVPVVFGLSVGCGRHLSPGGGDRLGR